MKTQVSEFLKALKNKLSLEVREEAAESCPSARLKQIEARRRECEDNMIDSIAMQKITVREAAVRWSSNPDAYVRQEILQPHQMAGNRISNFEIDPMSKLD